MDDGLPGVSQGNCYHRHPVVRSSVGLVQRVFLTIINNKLEKVDGRIEAPTNPDVEHTTSFYARKGECDPACLEMYQ